MATAKARDQFTIYNIKDIDHTSRYYLLQSSTLAEPDKPGTNPPGSSWTLVEPSYSSGSTDSLYLVDLTVYSNGEFEYSEVSLSSSYEAAKAAYNKAVKAQDTANTANARATYNYGTCSTAAATAAKAVSCSNFPTLYAGATIWVKFTYANTAASPTLNVNGTGAKTIYAYGAALTASSAYNWVAGATVQFIYNGSQWELADSAGLSKAETLDGRVTKTEASIEKLEGSIALTVKETDVTGDYLISKINLDSTTASIKAKNISLEGLVTANSNFKVLEDGSIEAVNGKFSGEITADTGKIGSWDISEGAIINTVGESTVKLTSDGRLKSDAPSSYSLEIDHGELNIYSGTGSNFKMLYLSGSTIGSDDGTVVIDANNHIAKNLSIGGKTAYGDKKAGLYLHQEGYIHLQRGSTGNPYIAFYYGSAETYTGMISMDSSTNLRFSGASTYQFGNLVVANRRQGAYWETTTHYSGNTGTSFMLVNGSYEDKVSGKDSPTTTTGVYLAGGGDTTSVYLRSYPVYARTYSSSATTVVVTASGTLGRSTSSSKRYKRDITYLTNADNGTVEADKLASMPTKSKARARTTEDSNLNLLKLPVCTYRYNDGYVTGEHGFDYDVPIMGFIAEDVETYAPDCALYQMRTVSVMDDDGNPYEYEEKTDVVENWSERAMIPRMLYIDQHQESEIQSLKAEVEALKEELAALKETA